MPVSKKRKKKPGSGSPRPAGLTVQPGLTTGPWRAWTEMHGAADVAPDERAGGLRLLETWPFYIASQEGQSPTTLQREAMSAKQPLPEVVEYLTFLEDQQLLTWDVEAGAAWLTMPDDQAAPPA